jgi:hypothetical protein
MHAKRQSSSETTHVIEATIGHLREKFLRAFTREKRYLTCLNFPFLSSPRDGNRTVSRIVHSPEFSEFIQRGDGTESKLMSLVGSYWEIVETRRLKSIIRSGKRTFAMIPQQRSAARRLLHAGVVFALETSLPPSSELTKKPCGKQVGMLRRLQNSAFRGHRKPCGYSGAS